MAQWRLEATVDKGDRGYGTMVSKSNCGQRRQRIWHNGV